MVTMKSQQSLGTFSLPAGDNITKALAYTKIAGGIFVASIGNYIKFKDCYKSFAHYWEQLQKYNKDSNTRYRIKPKIGLWTITTPGSILVNTAIATLLIQSGMKDLKKLKKKKAHNTLD